jgi:hypothetical protein
MRRVPVSLAAAALVVAMLPSAASAHPVMRYSDDHIFVSCEGFGDEQGTAYFFAELSTTYGSYAELGFWAAPASPEEGPPTWIGFEATVELSADGTMLTATLPMYEYAEEVPPEELVFVGDATVSATLEPIGDPEPIAYGSTNSNQHYRVEGTVQQLAVSGEVQLPDEISLGLDNCYGVHEIISVVANNPDAYVVRSNGLQLSCFWEADGLFAFLNGYAEQGFAQADMYLVTEDGDAYGGTDQVTFTSTTFSTVFDLFSAGEPEPEPEGIGVAAIGPGELVGSVSAQATLAAAKERSRFSDRFGFEKFTYTSQRLAVEGSVDVTLDGESFSLPMDDATCFAEAFRFQDRYATPNEHAKGPGAGKPLPNDLPQNATPIAMGDAVSVRSTAGTAAEPEAGCIAVDPEGFEYEVPIGHTAWWVVDGTGGEVTIDTAGSAFDTVVGVYVLGEEGYSQIGCVDDVQVGPDEWSLQAAITVGTDAGTAYYLQVGGFGGETGQLELAVH